MDSTQNCDNYNVTSSVHQYNYYPMIKVKGKCVPALKTHGRSGCTSPALLISALDVDEWRASRPGYFTLFCLRKSSRYPLDLKLDVCQSRFGNCKKRDRFCSAGNLNLAKQLPAWGYTHWATPIALTTTKLGNNFFIFIFCGFWNNYIPSDMTKYSPFRVGRRFGRDMSPQSSGQNIIALDIGIVLWR